MIDATARFHKIMLKIRRYIVKTNANPQRPYIFLSYKSKDKNIVRRIATYIMVKYSIEIYLDEIDTDLQKAVDISDQEEMKRCIGKAIRASTHVICFLSRNTKDSLWVPYEINYAREQKKHIAALRLYNQSVMLDCLKDVHIISKMSELKSYLEDILRNAPPIIRRTEKLGSKFPKRFNQTYTHS